MASTKKPPVHIERIEICRNCQGRGTDYDLGDASTITCRVCNGKGRVRVIKDIVITIETI